MFLFSQSGYFIDRCHTAQLQKPTLSWFGFAVFGYWPVNSSSVKVAIHHTMVKPKYKLRVSPTWLRMVPQLCESQDWLNKSTDPWVGCSAWRMSDWALSLAFAHLLLCQMHFLL